MKNIIHDILFLGYCAAHKDQKNPKVRRQLAIAITSWILLPICYAVPLLLVPFLNSILNLDFRDGILIFGFGFLFMIVYAYILMYTTFNTDLINQFKTEYETLDKMGTLSIKRRKAIFVLLISFISFLIVMSMTGVFLNS
ncbi:hypothetical protein HZR84_09990 [Hyphobacterium sp. CCMP332]|nr:hypothetical protein HZR84_09990 [Hyphobacterium sp. CCMP332]